MKTFEIDNTQETEHKKILESLSEQAKALKYIHNPNTWRLSALTLALHIHDCIILFENVKARWKEKLPFYEAWDVDFSYWKSELWSNVNNIASFTSDPKFQHWEKLSDTDYQVFLSKVNECLKGDIPINDILGFLHDRNTELSVVVVNMGNTLTQIITEIDEIPQTANSVLFINYYNELMRIYLTENSNNPYPIEEDAEIMTFDHWIASKSEKQRLKRISQRINKITNYISENKTWNEIWEDNVDIDNREIDKEGIGRSIYIKRRLIIGNKGYNSKYSMYTCFSSLALCTHLWEYQIAHSKPKMSFEDLPESRQIIIRQVENLIDNGEWQKPASAETIKVFIRQVLGIGYQMLSPEEESMSIKLWDLFESGQGDRIRVTFQNLIGYFSHYGYLPSSKGGDKLNHDFFKNKAKVYQNIDKGRPGNKEMPPRFNEILTLLDKYRPKAIIE